MLKFTDCICLKCINEPDCKISRLLRKYQILLMGEQKIWNKIINITFEVTYCKKFKKKEEPKIFLCLNLIEHLKKDCSAMYSGIELWCLESKNCKYKKLK